MRTIAVVTGGRADYGILVPVLRQIVATPGLALELHVTGAHLVEPGGTAGDIERDGFAIAERVPVLAGGDAPEAIARAIGAGVRGFADVFARRRPDLLLVVGDRYEIHAAVTAAAPFAIPVAHVHGGEVTEGAIDELFRHSITKLSHLHFVSTELHARRVRQLGEEPWRVTVSGAPGLDHLAGFQPLAAGEIARRFGVRIDAPFLLATFHPTTLEHEHTAAQATELVEALAAESLPVVVTAPNADTRHAGITAALAGLAGRRSGIHLVANLGTAAYFTLMAHAAAMVGNSSSGLVEAPSFRLPVVNIGTRQRGRLRAANVIDVGYGRAEIRAGIARALDPGFRAGLAGLTNPYGDGGAAPRIVQRLAEVPIDARLLVKRFHDQPGP
jgi:UDP-hydrolysing UDP-N-acetyl-D-glucosamine 2-epimerase